jgi:maleate isomerase
VPMPEVKWNVIHWRGSVGVVSPSLRVGAQDLGQALPPGVGVISRNLDARVGTSKEFLDVLDDIERHVRELAEGGVDVVAQNGAPPMLVHGYRAERELVARWEKEYGVPVITALWAQVEALRALGVRRVVGLTYFSDEMNGFAEQYLTEAGFEVLAVEGIGTFSAAHHIPMAQVYAHVKALVLANPSAEGVYLPGGAWSALGAIEPLEQDLGLPVVGGRGPESWAIQRRLHVRQPRPGYGRILSEFPSMPG